MSINSLILTTVLLFFVIILSAPTYVFAGHSDLEETDSAHFNLVSYFDLRERESFVQVTNTGTDTITLHVQIFNVPELCNENNFFDNYTGNDTHVYYLRDILTNDGSPSGAVLPDDAYGIVFISNFDTSTGQIVTNTTENRVLIGNMRIIDDLGYEYRTNLAADTEDDPIDEGLYYLQYNSNEGVILSDIIGITLKDGQSKDDEASADPLDAYTEVDVDIINNNENIFSCRVVVFACIDENSPRLEELLEDTEFGATVAALEYGINNAIPHSKGGELLCPGNTINEGWIRFNRGNLPGDLFVGYIGLNNGDGRGSFDAWFSPSDVTSVGDDDDG